MDSCMWRLCCNYVHGTSSCLLWIFALNDEELQWNGLGEQAYYTVGFFSASDLRLCVNTLRSK